MSKIDVGGLYCLIIQHLFCNWNNKSKIAIDICYWF